MLLLFLDEFHADIDVVLSTLDNFGSQHEAQCGQLKTSIHSQLAARAEQLQQLAEAVSQTVTAQIQSVTALSAMSAGQQETDSKWLAAYSDFCSQTAADQSQLSRDLHDSRLAPLLTSLSSSLTEQAEQLTALQAAIRLDIEAMLATFTSFTGDLADRMATVRGAVASFAAETTAALESLARENSAIQASEDSFKTVLEDMMARYKVHVEQVTASTTAMSLTTQNCGRLTGQLVETVQNAAAAIETGKKDMEERTEQQASQAVTGWTGRVRQSEEIITSVRTTSTTIGQTVSAYVVEGGERMGRFEAEAKARIEEAAAAKAAGVEQFGGRAAEAMAQLETEAAAISSGIQKNVQSDKEVSWHLVMPGSCLRSVCVIIFFLLQQKTILIASICNHITHLMPVLYK